MIVLPGYEPIEVLHQSRRTVLVRARRKTDGAPVVLKALRPELTTPRDLALLRHEHAVLRSLDVPGVLRVYDLVTHGATTALVLEDFGAVSLRQLLLGRAPSRTDDARAGQLSAAAVLRVGARVAEALFALHRRGVVHGDVKPHNILVTSSLETVKLADFGAASLLARESQEATSPWALRGTLAYMSPEQTGRVNRPIDERSDLYSLGVTMFEALTGALPFGSSDPLDVVHGHIAREPPRVDALSPDVPKVAADVVAKLLAKAPEDRYQSGEGARADLLECAERVGRGDAGAFPLGRRDRPRRLETAQKLYGREPELAQLQSAWQRVADGASGMLLVSGFSGIGKTALVSEVQKPLTREAGYFVSGKCDQVKRDTPYGSLVQALSSLFRQVLAEREEEVERYRTALMEAWGPGARAFIDLLPEVEKLVGPHAPLPTLGPSETQNRFNTLFDRFLQVFAQRGRPLVFFLDDLQWADSGTLSLLERQLAQPERRRFLVIGAYRNNEVDPSHPLSHTIANLRKAGVWLDELRIPPLSDAAIVQYLADTLRSTPARSAELAQLVLAKTEGNPFFVGQFLRALVDDGLLAFDTERGEWTYELEKVRQAKITDNVVELMVGKLQRLPQEAQDAAHLAACLGGRFSLDEVATLSAKTEIEIREALGPAVDEGFVLPVRAAGDDPAASPNAMRFQHDRVQQAAYDLRSASSRAETHLRIGRHILARTSDTEREARLLDIADHLLLGMSKLSGDEEKSPVARILLDAGRKAKASTAYSPALRYFAAGVELLGARGREDRYDLWAPLSVEVAESEYLVNHFERAEAAYEALIETLQTPLEKAVVTLKKMVLYVTLGRNWDVLDLTKRGFSLLGRELPDFRDKVAMAKTVERRFTEVELLLAAHKRRFEAIHPGETFTLGTLLDLPENKEPEHRALLEIMMGAIPPAYFFGEDVFKLVILEMVHLSLEGGIVDTSSFGLVLFAHVLATQRKEYEHGLEFGRLGMAVAERFHSLAYVGKTNYMMGAFVNHWGEHVATNLPYLERGHRLCVEAGELLWAGYSGSLFVWCLDAKGGPLDDILAETQKHLAFARRTHHDDLAWDTLIPQRAVKALKGETDALGSFSGDGFDEARELATMEKLEKKIPLNLYLIYKSEVLFLLGRFDEALALSRRSDEMIWGFGGMIVFAKHHFFHGLITAACAGDGGSIAATLVTLDATIERFAVWARVCPPNFRHQHLLLSAERARLAGDESAAITLYDQALEAAHQHGFVQDEAIASELAARFHTGRGRARFARAYLTDALSGYRAWGAMAKVRELEARHPALREPLRDPLGSSSSLETHTPTSSGGLGALIDQQALLRATQALSGEIIRPRLLSSLLDLLLQSAGARRAVVLVESEASGLVVEAELDRGSKPPDRAAGDRLLPESVLGYAVRTGEDVVLNDAQADRGTFVDPYFDRGVKSLLCLQMKRQGRRTGLLYLENDLSAGTFTRERLDALRVLASQAAIALDNADLYARLEKQNHDLEKTVEIRTRELAQRNGELGETLRQVVESQQRLAGELSEAAEYVRSLLPAPLEGAITTRWQFVPSAELGGDGLGYTWLDERRFAMWVVDVCGHGMASALLSISVLNALAARQVRADYGDPSSVLSAFNAAFPSSAHNGLYFTAFYGVIDVVERTITYATGGHPAAILLQPGAEPAELGTGGLMVGVVPEMTYEAGSHRLEEGARVIVFSDGAYEITCPDGKMLEYDAFLDALREAAASDSLPDHMVRFARRARGLDSLEDDFSMLEIELRR